MSKSTRSSRRQAAKQEAATSAPVSYHPAATPIDASSLSVTALFSTLMNHLHLSNELGGRIIIHSILWCYQM